MFEITIEKSIFGVLPNSDNSQKNVTAFKYTFNVQAAPSYTTTITTSSIESIASISTYGAALLNFYCPSQRLVTSASAFDTDVVVGYNTLEAFAAQPAGPYFGVTVGRYCNRIAKGKFKLATAANGETSSSAAATTCTKEYTLATNNGPNHLHGGPTGYHHRNWSSAIVEDMPQLVALMIKEHLHAFTDSPEASSSSASFSASEITFPCVVMWLVSADGEEGYPETLAVGCIFSVQKKEKQQISGSFTLSSASSSGYAVDVHSLRIDHLARIVENTSSHNATGPTVVNLTNHAYFNLAPVDTDNSEQKVDHPITDLHLALNADRFTPVDATAIPTGTLQPVAEVPAMDFYHTKTDGGDDSPTGTFFDAHDDKKGNATMTIPLGRRIGEAINDTTTEQIAFGSGYDHNWCLAGGYTMSADGTTSTATKTCRVAAVLTDPKRTNRFLRVLTTQPGIQLYTGNFLDNTIEGKKGKRIPHRSGLCLETQHFPDSPNQPLFPSTKLEAGENYHHFTVFELGSL